MDYVNIKKNNRYNISRNIKFCVTSRSPKRIQRLLDNLEIDFFDGSFDNLTT